MLAGLLLVTTSLYASEQPVTPEGTGQSERDSGGSATVCEPSTLGSPYIPVDSWVYPAVLRLYSLGYIDHVYLGMRPWTRASLSNMLEDIDAQIEDANTYGDSTASEAQDIYAALIYFLHYDAGMQCLTHQGNSRIESTYTVARGISGTPLRDSFHLGSTIINDYGRPYENGFNNYTGASGYATVGRFTLYVRGEFHEAPSATGYSSLPNGLAQQLATIDGTTNYYTNTTTYPTFPPTPAIPLSQLTTIPVGPIAATTDGRFIEAYLSAHVLNHEISFGKQDEWLGPGQGAAMAYSNNAENIYSFRINRIEPLHIPLLSRITGPFRYEFLVGPLKGHAFPIDPWVHVEKFSFRPTKNLEAGFERTVIWGGENHAPINLRTFLRGFFSVSPDNPQTKFSPQDSGARFGAFDFSYRLPFLRNWLTLYSDTEAHDQATPLQHPSQACYRPGLYLSHLPGIPKLDLRVEAVNTDAVAPRAIGGGTYEYWEVVQKQGYTNQGVLFGDWIGREDKGGQGWITYHMSGNEWLQVGVRSQKAAKDFIPGGTTLNDINFQVVKRIGKDFEVNGNFAYEHWKAPIYLPGQQTVTTTTIQLTWFPERKISF
jgi:hypothetical protein